MDPDNIFHGLLVTAILIFCLVWLFFPFLLFARMTEMQREAVKLREEMTANRMAILRLNDNLIAYGQSMERHLAAFIPPSPPRGEGWGEEPAPPLPYKILED